uniref:SH2 domain-containing protein n=1 Tax=Plectus sambesii TaxID=2011161 RepID=A0A914VW12_9BILA
MELDFIHAQFDSLLGYLSELRKIAYWIVEQLGEHSDGNYGQTEDSIGCLHNCISQLENLCQQLHQQTPLVTKQPDPMQKTTTKINELEVHFLGTEIMGIKQELNNAEVSVDIITKEDAREIVAATAAGQFNLKNVKPVGSISRRVQRVVMNEKGQMTVKWCESKLEKVDRRTNIGQIYVFLFRCKSQNGDICSWALSLPFMVTVNRSQDSELYSAIFWQRAFGSIDYDGDLEEESLVVSWSHLMQALTCQFKAITNAKRLLNQSDMQYIATKVFKSAGHGDFARDGGFVTYKMFAKDRISEQVSFSCWDWIFSIMQFVRQKEVLKFWEKNWLLGFISKKDAEERMDALDYPTLLLRFSDSQLGALSIVCMIEVRANGMKDRRFLHLIPFFLDDLQKLSLSERIDSYQLKNIHHLYANIDKQSVIGKKDNSAPCPNGYVSTKVVMRVVGMNNKVRENQLPTTAECRRKASCPINGHANEWGQEIVSTADDCQTELCLSINDIGIAGMTATSQVAPVSQRSSWAYDETMHSSNNAFTENSIDQIDSQQTVPEQIESKSGRLPPIETLIRRESGRQKLNPAAKVKMTCVNGDFSAC